MSFDSEPGAIVVVVCEVPRLDLVSVLLEIYCPIRMSAITAITMNHLLILFASSFCFFAFIIFDWIFSTNVAKPMRKNIINEINPMIIGTKIVEETNFTRSGSFLSPVNPRIPNAIRQIIHIPKGVFQSRISLFIFNDIISSNSFHISFFILFISF